MNEQLTLIYGYMHAMWRYRWSALVVSWLVLIVGVSVVLVMPDRYSAVTTVYVDTTSVMKPLLKGLAPEMDTRDELAVMNRVLLSRDNLLAVMRDNDMDLKAENNTEIEEMVEKMRRSVELNGGRQNIYELSYTNSDAVLAYNVVSKLLDTMIEDTLKSTRTDTATAQKFLDTQIKEYELRLSEAEQRLAGFKKENVGYMPDEKGSFYARLQRAQDAVDNTRSRLLLAQQRSSELKKQLKNESMTIDGLVVGGNAAEKLREYRERLKVLQSSYTEKHPDIVALNMAIEDIKKRMEQGSDLATINAESADTGEINPVYQEMKIEANKADVEVETLKVQLADDERKLAVLKDSIDVIPEVEAELTQLNRDYEVTRSRYLDLVERRESAKLAESAGQSSNDIKFRVIEPPIVPTKASGPPRVLYLLAVLVLAFGAGATWSFARFYIQPTFIDMSLLSKETGLPLLGSVSLYMTPEHHKSRKIQLATYITATCLIFMVTIMLMVFDKESAKLVAEQISSFE